MRRYLKNVRHCQRVGRDFIACKQARIETLGRAWDAVERQYINSVMARRHMQSKTVNPDLFADLHINSTLRVEMEKQSRRWAYADDKMEQALMVMRCLHSPSSSSSSS